MNFSGDMAAYDYWQLQACLSLTNNLSSTNNILCIFTALKIFRLKKLFSCQNEQSQLIFTACLSSVAATDTDFHWLQLGKYLIFYQVLCHSQYMVHNLVA